MKIFIFWTIFIASLIFSGCGAISDVKKEADEDFTTDEEHVIEFVEITMQIELNGITQKAVLDIDKLKVQRNLNHVDTSFLMHTKDIEIVEEILKNEVYSNGCQDCAENNNVLSVITSQKDNCCIFEESVTNEIAKYLLVPINSMLWPFAPQDEPHNVGHTSVNIQHYTTEYAQAYFHHGIDVIKDQPEKLFNPYDGRVTKIGYYRTEEVGESKYYFEVVVQTVNGLKFEFHHTDSESVPEKIYEIEGADTVLKAGEVTGKIVFWPNPDSFSGKFFHHIHFNVITEKGIKLNPLIMMIPQEDSIAPKIEEIYLTNSGRTKTLSTENVDEDFHVVIKVSDLADNKIWPNPPRFSKIEIKDSGDETVFEHSGYDFIAMMSENINEFVCDYYLCEIGDAAFSKGSYSEREFHIVVTAFDKEGNIAGAVEKDLFESGEHSVTVTSCDESGNCSERSLSVNL